jgi:hypothetical protein
VQGFRQARTRNKEHSYEAVGRLELDVDCVFRSCQTELRDTLIEKQNIDMSL